MIRRALFTAVAMLAGSAVVASAAPKDEVADAARKLADASGYSWKSNTEMAGGGGGRGRFGGPTDGKTEKGGVTYLSMTRGDNTIEAVIKGEKGAVKTQDGWQSFAELNASRDQGGGGQGRGRGMMGRMLQNYRTPAVEAQDIASKTKELAKSGDAYTGEMTEEGVKELLSFRGRRRGQAGAAGGDGNNRPAPTNAKGTVKFWLKDGQLAKYEYNVKGTMRFQGNDFDIDRTTTVEIKDVGSTKVQVPEEATAKLS